MSAKDDSPAQQPAAEAEAAEADSKAEPSDKSAAETPAQQQQQPVKISCTRGFSG